MGLDLRVTIITNHNIKLFIVDLEKEIFLIAALVPARKYNYHVVFFRHILFGRYIRRYIIL